MSETKTVMMPRELSEDELKRLFSERFYQTVMLSMDFSEAQQIDIMISVETIKAIYAKCVEHFGC